MPRHNRIFRNEQAESLGKNDLPIQILNRLFLLHSKSIVLQYIKMLVEARSLLPNENHMPVSLAQTIKVAHFWLLTDHNYIISNAIILSQNIYKNEEICLNAYLSFDTVLKNAACRVAKFGRMIPLCM